MSKDRIEGTPAEIINALRDEPPRTVSTRLARETQFSATFDARIGETIIRKVAESEADVRRVVETFIAMIKMEVESEIEE